MSSAAVNFQLWLCQGQCFAKCPYTCQFDWLSDQLCQSLDRLSDHFAKHWAVQINEYVERELANHRRLLHPHIVLLKEVSIALMQESVSLAICFWHYMGSLWAIYVGNTVYGSVSGNMWAFTQPRGELSGAVIETYSSGALAHLACMPSED